MEGFFMSKNNVYKNSWMHYLTKVVVDIMFYGGIVACLIIPYLSAWVTGQLGLFRSIPFPYNLYFVWHSIVLTQRTAIFFLSMVCAVYILWQLEKLFKTLLGGNPFVPANIICFRKMAIASAVIAVLFTIQHLTFSTLASGIVVAVSALATLFCLTLKDVFKQAVYYKEENDGVI